MHFKIEYALLVLSSEYAHILKDCIDLHHRAAVHQGPFIVHFEPWVWLNFICCRAFLLPTSITMRKVCGGSLESRAGSNIFKVLQHVVRCNPCLEQVFLILTVCIDHSEV